MPALLRRLRAEDAGLSLVELLVAMALTGLLGAMLLTTFVQGLRTTSRVQGRTVDTNNVHVALDEVSKRLRSAVDPDGTGPLTAFVSATATDVTFYSAVDVKAASPGAGGSYASVDQLPSRVRLWFDSATDTLREQVVSGSLSGGVPAWSGAGRTRVLASGLLDPQPRPVFSYLKSTDTTQNADGTTASTILTSGGALTLQGLTQIDEVEVWVSAQTGPGNARPVTAVVRVTLPNPT